MSPVALLALACAAASPGGTLTLDEALARARAHPRVAAARGGVEQAQARAAEARAGYLPSAALVATAEGATDNPVPGHGRPREPRSVVFYPSYEAGLQVALPIWDFGRALGQDRQAREAVRAATSDLAASEEEAAFQVRSAYFGALAAEELLAVAEETMGQMEKHLSLARESLAVGRRTRFDVTRAQVDLTSARIGRIAAANGVAAARSALSAAMGEDVGLAALARPAERPAPDPDPAWAAREAMARRPELAAAARRVAAQKQAVAAAEGASWPVLAAGGRVLWKGDDRQLVPNWQAGVTLTWPVAAGGADRARLREQEALLHQQVALREDLGLRVRAEAEQAALAVAEARARRAAADELVAQARDNLGLAEGRYESGVGIIIELADAQAALTAARAGAVRAGYDLATARARLDRAVGAP